MVPILNYGSYFHGPFNDTNGKLLHIQQWTYPDIAFSSTHLRSYSKNPNKPAFLAVEKMLQYLYTNSHHPIFYPQTPKGPNQSI